MSDGGGAVSLIVGFFFGLFLFYKGFKTLRKKRKVEHTPTSKIRGMSVGEVEIYGEAEPEPQEGLKIKSLDGNPISPFTNQKCVYYLMTIEEYKKQGKHSSWVVIHRKEYLHPFYVKDETGKVLVKPRGAEIHVPPDFEEEVGGGKNPSEKVMTYINENRIRYEGFLGFNKSLRFTERIIKVGDEVYVYGDAIPSGKMSIVGNENLIITKKDKNGFFFISDRDEKDVLNFFSKKVFLEIYGGAAVSIACLAIFLFTYVNG